MKTDPEKLMQELQEAAGSDELSIGDAWNLLDKATLEIKRLSAEVAEHKEALDLTLTGGNHAANILIQRLGPDFASKYPPDVEGERRREIFTADRDLFDIWCCWQFAMRARALISGKEPSHD